MSQNNAKGGGSPTGIAGGDLSNTYPNPTVVAIQGKTLNSSLASVGAAQDGYVLTYVNASSDWEAKPTAVAFTASGDLSGTATSQTVVGLQGRSVASTAPSSGQALEWNGSAWAPATISGSPTGTAGGDLSGTYPNPTVIQARGGNLLFDSSGAFQFSPTNTSVSIYQGTLSGTGTNAGTAMAVQAQNGQNQTGGANNNNGGDLYLYGGSAGTGGGGTAGTAGYVRVNNGSTPFLVLGGSNVQFDQGVSGPALMQAQKTGTGNTAGQTLYVYSQRGQNNTGGGNTSGAGGDVIINAISAGTASGGASTGANGKLHLQTGGSDRLTVSSTGVVGINNLSTGLVHADSSGNLTSSTLVDADVSASAAMAVSKLAAGTSGQLLLNTATPTPTWTTMGGDAIIGSTGTVTVQAIRGKTLASSLSSVGAAQDGYVLTYVNGSSDWEAKPQSGGGITALTGDVTASGTGSVAASVVKIQGKTLASSLASIGATQDGYFLCWVNGSSDWEAKPAPSGSFTAGGDLSGSSSSQQVVSITGGSGVVNVSSSGNIITWNSATTAPGITQTAQASTSGGSGAAGATITITAQAGQAATGASNNGGNGGNLVLAAGAGGTSGSATAGKPGYIKLSNGTVYNAVTKTGSYNMTFADHHIYCNFSGAANLNLPAPTNGLTFEIWDIGGNSETNTIILSRFGSEKISGIAAARNLTTNWGHWTVVSDGTDWYVG